MKERFICYDGVENNVTYHKTEEEAIEQLKAHIENGREDGEWWDGIECCFVAEIKYKINQKETPATQAYIEEGITHFIEMEIEQSVPISS